MNSKPQNNWIVKKIAVIGPGIVGMPMAAMLAHAKVTIGADRPAKVLVIQRGSPTSGWKVDAINSGKSVIGGIEPDLDAIVAGAVADGLLSASNDYRGVQDADIILICVQTDKKGFGPDYGPLMDALENICKALQNRPAGAKPLVIFESTLAPSSMITVIRDFFSGFGLIDGKDILLGNSPNRVMPGRLVERIRTSDKVVGGLSEEAVLKIGRLYKTIVTGGALHLTNSLSAEIIKTLENAYRDVRIAFSSEIVRFCDEHDFDFYRVRDEVNSRLAQTDSASRRPDAVPVGALLVPAIGVGGHCLPKDGILLLWRMIESGADMSNSLFLQSRTINDESPAATIRLAESRFGTMTGKKIALLGTAYRFNSEDTRNSPTLALGRLLIDKGNSVTMHDPYVKPGDQNIARFNLQDHFTNDLPSAVAGAEIVFFCAAHRVYGEGAGGIVERAPRLKAIVDGCNLFQADRFGRSPIGYVGIGKGSGTPPDGFVDFVHESFSALERGTANELRKFIDFANEKFVRSESGTSTFNEIRFEEVRRIAATCGTGCAIAEPGPVGKTPVFMGFSSRLVECGRRAGR